MRFCNVCKFDIPTYDKTAVFMTSIFVILRQGDGGVDVPSNVHAIGQSLNDLLIPIGV
jgi:hypothetical protein